MKRSYDEAAARLMSSASTGALKLAGSSEWTRAAGAPLNVENSRASASARGRASGSREGGGRARSPPTFDPVRHSSYTSRLCELTRRPVTPTSTPDY